VTPLVWLTRDPLPAVFLVTWMRLLGGAPGAHFAYRTDVLRWDARHGRHAAAVLVEDGGRTGGLVLRETREGWACGWPWRWCAMYSGWAGSGPVDLEADDAARLFEAARAVAGPRRLRAFFPHPPPRGVPGYPAGATIMWSVVHDDGELLRSMGDSKRRMVKRARAAGYVVREATSPHDFRAFAAVHDAAHRRRAGAAPRPAPPADPAPGEGWREWELPWMWLLIAERNGVVASGAGDSIGPGWSVEGRTAASDPEARREGAFALLCLEEARAARDRGFRWINHGGDTYFKREVSGRLGTRVPIWCWLSGGGGWRAANVFEASWRGARARLAARRRGTGSRGSAS